MRLQTNLLAVSVKDSDVLAPCFELESGNNFKNEHFVNHKMNLLKDILVSGFCCHV